VESAGVLVHLLARAARPARDGWEQYTQLHGTGSIRFRHALCVGAEQGDEALTRLADEPRFPVRALYARDPVPGYAEEWLRITPDHLRLLACRRVAGELEIRMVESAGRPASGRLELRGGAAAARLTDLTGRDLAEDVRIVDGALLFDCLPWQIRNLRIVVST
jgi:hypothetical protein